jgi:hypothetical protein
MSLPTFDANNLFKYQYILEAVSLKIPACMYILLAYQCNYKHIVETNTTPT